MKAYEGGATSRDIRQIPGQYMVAAMDLLPRCGPDSTTHEVEISIPFGDRFRVSFQARRQAWRGCSPTWIWIPFKAERLERQQ